MSIDIRSIDHWLSPWWQKVVAQFGTDERTRTVAGFVATRDAVTLADLAADARCSFEEAAEALGRLVNARLLIADMFNTDDVDCPFLVATFLDGIARSSAHEVRVQ